ncbi:flagellar protein FliS [Paenibacillus curdlanolyticus YK9]|uniref:Flagellar secretion chaperone FliS n=1 Tax=Paenibacillus curdlanolyticus YK9 TaxID=717606 RepID=E0IEC4_9BACL|nr:flagellar export chaperone FliS [Paenibacillus curdlanolyticus]EFM09012.1 flagellar protein FliS [Paenibacillus curdlanolyticus YK9]
MLQAQANYANTQIQTASPGELTLLLYNGCIKFIKKALQSMENQNVHGKHENFIKAQNIIDELQSTLNMEYELSNGLFQLYTYIQEKLSFANVKMDRAAAEECIQLISELRDTWLEALKSLKRGGITTS